METRNVRAENVSLVYGLLYLHSLPQDVWFLPFWMEQYAKERKGEKYPTLQLESNPATKKMRMKACTHTCKW